MLATGKWTLLTANDSLRSVPEYFMGVNIVKDFRGGTGDGEKSQFDGSSLVVGGPKPLQQRLNLMPYNYPAGYCVQPQYFDILLSQLGPSQLGHVLRRSPGSRHHATASFIQLPTHHSNARRSRHPRSVVVHAEDQLSQSEVVRLNSGTVQYHFINCTSKARERSKAANCCEMPVKGVFGNDKMLHIQRTVIRPLYSNCIQFHCSVCPLPLGSQL